MTGPSRTYSQFAAAEKLFDRLPDVVFFIKDIAGRYLTVNDTLVERCGLDRKSDLIGRNPSQVLGAQLGDSYESQDRLVIATGQPIENRLELHIYPNRKIGWCLTNKYALFDHANTIIGVAGISQDLRTPDISHKDYEQLAKAVKYARQSLSSAPTIERLARVARLSPYQLDRRVKRVFGLTTGQWILKLRLDFAQQQLLDTNKAIAEIGLDAGYSDQSAFTRQFRRATGLTPSQFRSARAV